MHLMFVTYMFTFSEITAVFSLSLEGVYVTLSDISDSE